MSHICINIKVGNLRKILAHTVANAVFIEDIFFLNNITHFNLRQRRRILIIDRRLCSWVKLGSKVPGQEQLKLCERENPS